MGHLEDIRIQSNLPFKVGYDRIFVLFLDLTGQMGLSHPSATYAQIIGQFDLVEEVEHHLPFIRRISIDFSLTN